ncbi:flagellar basal body rod protein FlgB [Marinibaculum pumilum]|uniref:Flagellar basal body rod protein FlgB n=1 Tax=Marinibaculum pumilum TaxID=1766165 RepID=A0ABV7KYI1_9PROT
MDLKDIPVFGAIGRKLGWLNQRQAVLAENVANANTPGYRSVDLKKLDFKELMRGETTRIGVAKTDDQHVTGTVQKGNGGLGARVRDTEILPSGNSVNLEAEMVKVAETQIAYQAVTGLYRKQIGLLKIALGKGR